MMGWSSSAYMSRQMPQRDEEFHQVLTVLENIGQRSLQNNADVTQVMLSRLLPITTSSPDITGTIRRPVK